MRNIIDIQSNKQRIYLLVLYYHEADTLNAVGQIVTAEWTKDYTSLDPDQDRNKLALNTNDALTALWVSPEGNLWCVSAHGTVYTTAPVSWLPPRWKDLDYEEGKNDVKLTWNVTSVPNGVGGYAPNISTLWGSGDNDIHFGTYEGDVYHWNGKRWAHIPPLVDIGNLWCMKGAGKKEIYCLATDKKNNISIVLFFDGKQWNKIPWHKTTKAVDLSGLTIVSPGKIMLCGREGEILEGNKKEIKKTYQHSQGFNTITYFEEKVILAPRAQEVWEWKYSAIECIKKFTEVKELIFFYPTEKVLFSLDGVQLQEKSYIIQYSPHDTYPASPGPWCTWDF